MTISQQGQGQGHLPGWVPPGALHYIAHTEKGAPIRALAREAGCHASTVLRQIRKVEMRRDDPLVDAALRKIGAHGIKPHHSTKPMKKKETAQVSEVESTLLDDATLAREAMRVLRRLCETGAVLAVAADLDRAVVVRDIPGGCSARTAVVEATVAQAMALQDWIAPANAERIVRYKITATGRTALNGFLAQAGQTLEDPSDLETINPKDGFDADAQSLAEQPMRAPVAESPLAALARRRDKEGTPFLAEKLVHAGERLREDFELAQMDGTVTQNWERFLTPGGQQGGAACDGGGAAASGARGRVESALQDLGPGLSDVVLRCCCYLEGLETTEKRLGWSARSGKIVLRIALMRLKRHYDETVGPHGPLIG